MPDSVMSPSTLLRRGEESKVQTSASSSSLLSPKSSVTEAPSSTPGSRVNTAGGVRSASTSRSGRRPASTSSARTKKDSLATKKKKKQKVVEDPTLVRRLIEVAAAGQVEQLRAILNMEGDPKLDFDATAGEAVVAAAEQGQSESLSLLLSSGASVNCLSGRPLQRACAANQLLTATELLAQGADPIAPSTLTLFTPLMCCCMASSHDPTRPSTPLPSLPLVPSINIEPITSPLSPTSRFANPPLLSPSHAATAPIPLTLPPPPSTLPLPSSFASTTTSSLSSARSPRPLPSTLPPLPPLPSHPSPSDSSSTRLPLLRLLLSFPSTLTSLSSTSSPTLCGPYNGWTALHFAADGGAVALVRELIGAVGAGGGLEVRTGQGDTALSIAAERGHGEVVKALVVGGADIGAVRRGLTVVEWCAYRGEVELVEWCVAHGATTNLNTRLGWLGGEEGGGKTLGEVLRAQMSEALMDRLHLALHRGSRRWREVEATKDALLLFSWHSGEGAEGGAGAKGSKAYLPSTAVDHIIAFYQ